jgi:site-specific DNA-methyltransferase (adenine-specific)
MELNKIYNTDALEYMRGLPDKSVDLVLCDPPYGINYNDKDLASVREKVFGGGAERNPPRPIYNDGQEAIEVFEAMLIEATRVLKKGYCCCCCCCGGGPKPLFAEWTLLMDKHIGFKQAVPWIKPGMGLGIHFRRSYEFMLIAQNGSPDSVWNGGNNTVNWISLEETHWLDYGKIIPSADQHPTQKPVALMQWVIQLFTNPGMTVLDPFMGSGTTAIACIREGRNFIGTELDPVYFEMASKRIAQEQAALKLF